MKQWRIKLGCLLIGLCAPVASAQELLPQGVGIYQFGYRYFTPQTQMYNGAGEKVLISDRISKDFTGQNLLEGKGGADLQRLAQELQKYDAGVAPENRLLNKIDLGRLEADVEANVNATIIGLGFGITDSITVFGGVPWVQADVQASMRFTGSNNAQAIKAELGDLAFDELKDGLDQASAISAGQVLESIENAGFAPIGAWNYRGYGDALLGVKTGWGSRLGRGLKYDLGLTTTLHLPTGHVDDPDILTDVGIGRGYTGLELRQDHKMTFRRRLHVGLFGSIRVNQATQMKKRVPVERELLVPIERKVTTKLEPGHDTHLGGGFGYQGRWLGAGWVTGVSRHLRDSYTGPISGNYDRLSEDSDKFQLYHEAKFSVSSVKAFQAKRFPVPFIFTLAAHLPVQARNTADERYFEAGLASFFSTPLAKDPPKRKRVKSKSRKQKYPGRTFGKNRPYRP